jgi:hypothetical protein
MGPKGSPREGASRCHSSPHRSSRIFRKIDVIISLFKVCRLMGTTGVAGHQAGMSTVCAASSGCIEEGG